MAVITSRKAGSDFEKRQGVLLPKRGVYGAILSRYTQPKEYTNAYGTKEKIGFGFVITHDQAYRQLPRFCGAFKLVPNTLFYSPEKLTSSLLVEYLFAFRGGKRTKAKIAESDINDFDDFIGRPVLLLAEPSEKPGNDGIYYNNISGIDPIDKEMYAAMRPTLSTIEYAVNDKTALKYVKSPAEAFEDSAPVKAAAEEEYQFPDDDIPF